ncbi:hypothetical protein H4S08_003209 [Coemansia sp. RSA 1365]|nr:hypothetical protein H4S08_003209 [Coemansia sp. RSA 1365]
MVYFNCVGGLWQEMTCVSGTTCRVVGNSAVCVDPEAPIETPGAHKETVISCEKNNATMCDESNKSSFYICTDNKWAKMKCDGANVCSVRNGKAYCVDQATASAPVQPCDVTDESRCVPDNKKMFQLCTDNLWTNSTCDKNNVCGIKHGRALCHDPSQPIVDVPDQPCDDADASQCVPEDDSLYQICSNGLWTNLTCDGTNICRMKDDKAICVDSEEADNSYTSHKPTPYKAHMSLGVSKLTAYSWGLGLLFSAIVFTFGTHI